MQQQVWPFVSRETPSKAQGQSGRIEEIIRLVDFPLRGTGGGELPRQALACVLNEMPISGGAEVPNIGIGDFFNIMLQSIGRPEPASFSTCFRPKIVCCRRVPAWHVNAIGYVCDWYFARWPAGKEWCKEPAAHLAMQATHSVDRAAAADRQVGHVETFR